MRLQNDCVILCSSIARVSSFFSGGGAPELKNGGRFRVMVKRLVAAQRSILVVVQSDMPHGHLKDRIGVALVLRLQPVVGTFRSRQWPHSNPAELQDREASVSLLQPSRPGVIGAARTVQGGTPEER
jgi:hypothetical protein